MSDSFWLKCSDGLINGYQLSNSLGNRRLEIVRHGLDEDLVMLRKPNND